MLFSKALVHILFRCVYIDCTNIIRTFIIVLSTTHLMVMSELYILCFYLNIIWAIILCNKSNDFKIYILVYVFFGWMWYTVVWSWVFMDVVITLVLHFNFLVLDVLLVLTFSFVSLVGMSYNPICLTIILLSGSCLKSHFVRTIFFCLMDLLYHIWLFCLRLKWWKFGCICGLFTFYFFCVHVIILFTFFFQFFFT